MGLQQYRKIVVPQGGRQSNNIRLKYYSFRIVFCENNHRRWLANYQTFGEEVKRFIRPFFIAGFSHWAMRTKRPYYKVKSS
jgi:hypothetical protein